MKKPDPIKDFEKLSKLAEEQRSKKDRIRGSMDQIATSLKQKGLKSLKEAMQFIKTKKTEKEKKEKILHQKLEAFRAKYEEHL